MTTLGSEIVVLHFVNYRFIDHYFDFADHKFRDHRFTFY